MRRIEREQVDHREKNESVSEREGDRTNENDTERERDQREECE